MVWCHLFHRNNGSYYRFHDVGIYSTHNVQLLHSLKNINQLPKPSFSSIFHRIIKIHVELVKLRDPHFLEQKKKLIFQHEKRL